MAEDNFVFVCVDENAKEEGVELPVEDDGTILLSVIQSQFNGASGLKYRNPVSGTWRAVKIVDDVLRPPDKGWADTVYIVVITPSKEVGGGQPEDDAERELGAAAGVQGSEKVDECDDDFSSMGYASDSYKRKLEDSEGQRASKNPRSHSPDNYQPKPGSPGFSHIKNRNQEDVIILGLEWSVTDQELRSYFEQFGEVAHCEVKKDLVTGKSRGFGFVRYSDRAVQVSVFESSHTIKGRRVELKYPKQQQSQAHMPNKLFVGCLPLKPEVTTEELKECFSQYGTLSDVYIPKPYRGFGFVTFVDAVVAQKVVNMREHSIRKSNLNVSFADPRGGGGGSGGMKSMPAFSTDPFNQMGYASHLASRFPAHQAGVAPRFPFPAQPQQPQAYSLGYGTPQHVAAVQRPDATQNPNAMGAVHAVPVSGSPGMNQSSAGLYAVSYANGAQQQQPTQQQQQGYGAAQSPSSYR